RTGPGQGQFTSESQPMSRTWRASAGPASAVKNTAVANTTSATNAMSLVRIAVLLIAVVRLRQPAAERTEDDLAHRLDVRLAHERVGGQRRDHECRRKYSRKHERPNPAHRISP